MGTALQNILDEIDATQLRQRLIVRTRQRRALALETRATVTTLGRSLSRHGEFPWDAEARVASTPISELLRQLRQLRTRRIKMREPNVDYVVALYLDLRRQAWAGRTTCAGEQSQFSRSLGAFVSTLQTGDVR